VLELAATAQLMLCLSHLAAADLLDCNHLVIFCHLLLQATLESSLEALNVKKFDLAFAVDPLFHKTSAQFDEGGARGACRGRAGKYASLGGMWHAGWGCRCCKRGQTEHHAVCAPVVTVEHHLHCCASQQASVRESTRGRSPPPMPQACCSTTCRCSMAATLFSTPWMSQRRRWMRAAMWTLAPWWAASCVL